MEIYSPQLFVEINNSEYIFAVSDEKKQDDFKLIYKSNSPMQGIENHRIINFDIVFNIIKKNIYTIEQKFNFTFKEVILIIDNFDCSFINFSGFKKLNGSQILKENITYILNSLKSNIDAIEKKKTILHIFNSNYNLDKKNIENLPIGLFGDFYSHELSFCLINNNDYMNLNNIFDKCNLKIKKILLKSFVEGSNIINKNSEFNTFFKIKIDENNSQIFYFENNSLKFEQNFNFGSELILRDISKVTFLEINIIRNFLDNMSVAQDILKDEFIEKNFFENNDYKKVKKKLLFEIAKSRIEEILEKLLIKNINLLSFIKKGKLISLNINDKIHFKFFKNIYRSFLNDNNLTSNFVENTTTEDLIKNVNKLVHYGWKKEAIPVTLIKKSALAKFFETLFR